MEKIKLVVILFVLLFAQRVHCEQNNMEHSYSCQNVRNDKLSFKTSEFSDFDSGELPSAQVLFNIVPEAPASFTNKGKTKELNWELIPSKTKIIFNLSFHQTSIFGRYCSVFVQIFLKTACYRL